MTTNQYGQCIDSHEERSGRWWHFFEQGVWTPLASWMNPDAIAAASEGMSPGERRRLHGNEWIDPGEESGYLTLAEALACVDSTLEERYAGVPGVEYFASIDYGGVTDRCALCVMHLEPAPLGSIGHRVVVDRLDCWQGSHEKRTEINWDAARPHVRSVQGWIELTRKQFRLAALVVDPYQLEGLAIHYELNGLRVLRFEYMSGKRNYQLAQMLQNCIQNKSISWSAQAGLLPGAEDDTFAKELARLIKVPTSYGYRFDHESGRHDDRAVAVGMGLVYALPEGRPRGSMGPLGIGKEEKEPVDPIDQWHKTEVPQFHPPIRTDWAKARGLFGM